MHDGLHLLTIGVASNLDNLAVGVAYGIRRIRISTPSNLAIAGIAFAFSALSVMAGTYAGRFMAARSADLFGAVLWIGIGIWVLPLRRPQMGGPSGRRATLGHASTSPRPSLTRILQAPELADSDHSGVISIGESLLLGVALSLNCLTNGLPAGLWKLQPLAVAACNAVLSFASLWCGVRLGKRYGAHWLGRKADVLAGVLLILLGAYQVYSWLNR